jgi:hypothetical protein
MRARLSRKALTVAALPRGSTPVRIAVKPCSK